MGKRWICKTIGRIVSGLAQIEILNNVQSVSNTGGDSGRQKSGLQTMEAERAFFNFSGL